MTIVVWVLILAFNVERGGAPLVIDNISSQKNCVALARMLQDGFQGPYGYAETARCIAVRKVKS